MIKFEKIKNLVLTYFCLRVSIFFVARQQHNKFFEKKISEGKRKDKIAGGDLGFCPCGKVFRV